MGSVGSGRDRTECEGACGPAQRAGGDLVYSVLLFPFEDGPGFTASGCNDSNRRFHLSRLGLAERYCAP